MNNRALLTGLAGLVVALFVVGVALAQDSASFDLSWQVLAGGGRWVDSTHYAVNGTVGQPTVGHSDSASYGMQSGYWQNWPDYRVYLPVTLKTTS